MDRLWSHVDKTGDCWLWTGRPNTNRSRGDYGRISTGELLNGRPAKALAHRVVYENCVGPIPDGMEVLHRCDTPRCCRPDHLFLGDNALNMADKVAKGRSVTLAVRGSGHGNSVINEEVARQIREEYCAGGVTQMDLAARYGLPQGSISRIVRGQAWVHAGGPLRRCYDRKLFVPHPLSPSPTR